MDKYIIKKGEKHKKKAISPKNNPGFYRPLRGLQDDMQIEPASGYFTSYSGIGRDSPAFMALSRAADFAGSSHQ